MGPTTSQLVISLQQFLVPHQPNIHKYNMSAKASISARPYLVKPYQCLGTSYTIRFVWSLSGEVFIQTLSWLMAIALVQDWNVTDLKRTLSNHRRPLCYRGRSNASICFMWRREQHFKATLMPSVRLSVRPSIHLSVKRRGDDEW